MTTVSINIGDNVSIYRGPPGDFCPYCLEKGRGVAKFIPVMHEINDIIWLCENWRVCLYPLIAGPETVRKHTMPRTSVDPKLLGYIPLDEDDRKKNRNRPDLMNPPEEDKSSTISSVTAPRSPSISHCTTSSMGSEPEVVSRYPKNIMSKTTIAPLPNPSPGFEESLLKGLEPEIDSIFTTLPISPPLNMDPLFSFVNDASEPPLPKTHKVESFANDASEPPPKMPKVKAPPFSFAARRQLPPPPSSSLITPIATQPLAFSSPIARPAGAHLSTLSAPSTSMTATSSYSSAPSKKRALIETKKTEKTTFPGYESCSGAGGGTMPKLDVTSKANTDLLSMLMKKLKKGKK